MKKEGLSVSLIVKMTGLAEEEINKLWSRLEFTSKFVN
jgi:hypothetical protein